MDEVQTMEKKLQFFVAGLGRFGTSVALTLEKLGYDVMAMDSDEDVVQDLSDQLGYVVCADATDEKNLVAIGAGNADIAVIGIGNIEGSLLATLQLKDMGVKTLVVKALNELHGKMLEKIGADKIIFSEKEMGIRVAHNLTSPGIIDYIEMNNNITILTVQMPKEWVGKNLIEIDARRKYNINVVAVLRGTENMINPAPDMPMQEGDKVTILGDSGNVRKVAQELEIE
jgi:trk system potassium uptake protein